MYRRQMLVVWIVHCGGTGCSAEGHRQLDGIQNHVTSWWERERELVSCELILSRKCAEKNQHGELKNCAEISTQCAGKS